MTEYIAYVLALILLVDAAATAISSKSDKTTKILNIGYVIFMTAILSYTITIKVLTYQVDKARKENKARLEQLQKEIDAFVKENDEPPITPKYPRI